MKSLEHYLIPTQTELFGILKKEYRGKCMTRKSGYVLVKGEAPIMLVAHMDTVHDRPVKDICKTKDGNILMSPQGIGGDDRCGVYALTAVYEQSEKKPWLLFTCDEEVGGKGADAFVSDYEKKRLPKALRRVKCLIEIDRKGSKDAVYYDCGNDEFEKYITSKGFKTDYGSYSDISTIAPVMEVAAVNLSSGYYNAHTTHEYIVRSELNATIAKVVSIVEDACKVGFPKYEYVESVRYSYYGYRMYDKPDRWTDMMLSDSKASGRGSVNTMTYDDVDVYDYFPADLPEEYEEFYVELLDIYSFEELEEMREMYGDRIIKQMYECEIGYPDSKVHQDYEDEEALFGWSEAV